MFHRLLVAVDGSGSTPVTVSFAGALARQCRAHLHVLHVNAMLVGAGGHARRTDQEAMEVVESAVRELHAVGADATGTLCRVAVLDIPRAVAEIARMDRSDAIVIGSYRRRGIARLRGNGLRDRLVRTSAIPVITAPAPLAMPGRRAMRAVTRGDALRTGDQSLRA